MKGYKFLYFTVVMGAISCAVFWTMPGNKYEWMRTDPVVGNPSVRLPADPDYWVPLAFFAFPVLAISLANLAMAIRRLRGAAQLFAIGFSLFLLGVLVVKFRGL
jgi:hypothetical protein